MVTRLLVGLMVVLALTAWSAPARAVGDAGGAAASSAAGTAQAEDEKSTEKSSPADINPIPMHWQDVQGDLAIWTAAVFLVVLAVLWKFAWRPIAEGLDKRERGIADQIAQAAADQQKAAKVLSQYEGKLAMAQDQVRAIIDRGRRDAERAGRELIDKAKQEAQAQQQRALKQIDAAAAAAVKDLADQGATLAVELAGKIVQAKLTPSDHSQLIEQAVKEMMNAE